MRKLLFIGLLLISHSVIGQATANFTASVTIVEPLKVSTLSNLNFAEVQSGEGGTVTLSANGQRSGYGGVELGEETNVSPASFNISGKAGTKINLVLPKGEFVLTNGTENIIIKDFTSNWSNQEWLREGGNLLKVGASILIKENQKAGFYTSTKPMEVVVNYD